MAMWRWISLGALEANQDAVNWLTGTKWAGKGNTRGICGGYEVDQVDRVDFLHVSCMKRGQ